MSKFAVPVWIVVEADTFKTAQRTAEQVIEDFSNVEYPDFLYVEMAHDNLPERRD